MDTNTITTAVVAIISAGAIPALAWMLRDGGDERLARIEKLADLAEKSKGNVALEKVVNDEIAFESKRRGGTWKWVMFGIYVAGAIPAGFVIGMLSVALIPGAEAWNIWWYLLAAAAISVTFAARNYMRSGPKYPPVP